MATKVKTHLSKIKIPIGTVGEPSIHGQDPDDNGTGVNWYGNDEIGFVGNAGADKLTLLNGGELKLNASIAAGNDFTLLALDRTSPVTTAKYTAIDFTGNALADKMITLRALTASAGNHGFQLKTAASGAFNTLPILSGLSSNKLGINIITPQFPLHLAKGGEVTQAAFVDTSLAVFSSESDDSPGLTINSYSIQNTTRAVLKGVKAKGTTTSPTAVTDTNYTLSLLGAGYDGTSNIITAAIDFQVSGTPATGVMPQAIVFRNGPTNALIERMRITPAGKVGIATAVPGPTLGVNGSVGIGSTYSLATLTSGILAVNTAIGVNTTTPTYMFHSFSANANVAAFIAETTSTGSGGTWYAMKDGLTSPPHRMGVSSGLWTFQVNATSRADLQADGFRYKADYSATWDDRSLVDKAYVDGLSMGGGGATDLTFSGSSSPVTLQSSTGTDVIFTAGTNITLSQTGNNLTIAASGGSGANLTFSGSSSPVTLVSDTGTDVIFTAGSGITFSQTGNNLTISNSLFGSTLSGVLDQVNMLDISAPAGIVQIAPNIPEGTLSNTYDAADTMMFYDNSASAHRKMTVGTYLGSGFVDKVSTQVDIGGDKGFTTSLHFGAPSLPTNSLFGTTTGTNVFFAPTTTAITETNFQNTQGLVFHNFVNSGTQVQTANIIATGTDNSGGVTSSLAFWVRPSGGGQNWIQPVRILGSNITLFGGATSGAAIGGQLQVNGTNGGQVGYVGGFNDWLMGTVNSSSATFFVSEAGVTRAHIDSGSGAGWIATSDIRLKENIENITVLPYINTIRGVKYNLIEGNGKTTIGVIAQEIEEYFPEAISNPEDPEQMKGVSYNAIAAIALQGVKELKHYIDALERRITSLEKQLNNK